MAAFGPIAAAILVGLVGRAAGRRAASFAAIGAAIWLGSTLAIAASGTLADFARRPPPLMVLMAATVALGVALGASKLGGRVASGVSLPWLIGVQAIRFPLELVMHRAAAERVMPVQMTFGAGGWNYDIVTGATAVLVALAIARVPKARALGWAWLALAWITLVGIAAVAIASTPLVRAFGTEPHQLNTWVARPPYVWLLAGPVALAIFGQIVVGRALWRTRRRTPVRTATITPTRGRA